MNQDYDPNVNVRLPMELLRELDKIAEEQGRTKGDLMREAITRYVEEHRQPEEEAAT